MAEHLESKDESTTNPCCRKWRDKYLKCRQKCMKTEKARVALKMAVGIYEEQYNNKQKDILKLEKAYEKDKEKELAARGSLENEISSLKSEIVLSSQKGGSVTESSSEELTLLRERVLNSEKEIKCLCADKMKAVEEKKRADMALEGSKAEKNKVDQALSNLKAQLLNLETEKKQLKKDLHKEKARVESEKKRADEVLKTAKTEQAGAEDLKADLSSLKSEDVSLQHNVHLRDQKLEIEIGRLKEVINKERIRADSEIKKAEIEKKNSNKVRELLKAEQTTVDEQRKLVDLERKKAEDFAHQLQKLKCEVEGSKLKGVNKKLEAERKKSNKEKKKAEEQQKIAEMSTKHALEEKNRADRLHQQLEEYQQKYDKLKKEMEEIVSSRNVEVKNNETNSAKAVKNNGQVKQKANRAKNCADSQMEIEAELKKAADLYKLKALEEKIRADKLAQLLEDAKQKIKTANKDSQDPVSSRSSADPTNSALMKLLKKRLKFEKERVKHAKQVAEHEKKCKKAVEKELHQLKMEFTQFSNRIGLCSCSTICNEGKSCPGENGNINSRRKFLQPEGYPLNPESGKELVNPTCAAKESSEYFKPNLDRSAPSLLLSGTLTESTSGTASKMEPLLGGSNRKKLDGSALVSSMASFSDQQLMGSQGKCVFSNTKENSNLQLSSEVNRTSYDAEVADNNVNSLLRVRNKDGNTRKRKRLLNAIESIEHLYTEGQTWHAKIAKNVSALHGILGFDYDQHHISRDTCFEEVPVRPSCISIEQNLEPGIRIVRDEEVDFNAFDDNGVKLFDGDHMKLLDLDSEIEEARYRAAVERPISPILPIIEFKSNQSDDLQDSRPSKVNESESAYDDSSQCIVVFPEIRDICSLSKIFQSTGTFTSQCCAFSQSDYVVKNLLSAFSTNEFLSPKEKVCVFFSLFLKSFSSIALTNFNYDENFLNSIDIFSGQIKKVMFDVETRTMFAEVCDLDDLITLIQSFIINGRVLINTDISSDFKVNIFLNNESVPLSLQKASLHQLVLGAVLLASVCAAFDRIDSVCEASYTISHITSSSTLTILHVFACVCGEKLLAHGDYSLIMTVISSLVTYCESENLSSGFLSCAKCPFSVGAVSMEELASLLLKRFSACCMHKFGMTPYKSINVPDGTLSNLGDVLSLLELVASKMSWGWVCKNITSQLLKLLEASVMETPLTAVFVLLGEMARFGVDANGYQDVEVENIRAKLSSFISRSTSSKISLPVQFAAINALLGTMPLSFQEICSELPSLVSPSTATDCIQNWFSLLGDEHKSLSVKLFTATSI